MSADLGPFGFSARVIAQQKAHAREHAARQHAVELPDALKAMLELSPHEYLPRLGLPISEGLAQRPEVVAAFNAAAVIAKVEGGAA